MAPRDLSRTVIEGGRDRFNRWQRRRSHRAARTHQRAWLDTLTPDGADGSSPRPLAPVHRMFYDKLAPMRRWLLAQVGRRWDDVRADVAVRFDVRTVAGQHIVYDHLLTEVIPRHRGFDARWPALMIDDAGVLRHGPYWQRVRRARRPPPRPPWAPPGWVARLDGAWWWVGDRPCGRCVVGDRCRLGHLWQDGARHHFTAATRLRRLTATEVGRFTSSPAAVQAVLRWTGGAVFAPEDAPRSRESRPR